METGPTETGPTETGQARTGRVQPRRAWSGQLWTGHARPRRDAPVSRARVAATGGVVVAAGLAMATLGRGPVADLAGDVLYAVLVHLGMVLIAPRGRPWVHAGLAFVFCAAVECAQLTPWPAVVVDAWWPARFVLGTTFAPLDLVAYAAGVALCATLASRRAARRLPARAHEPVTGAESSAAP